MKLSKLYSNKSDQFSAINFNSGVNVVIAEIRLAENLRKDTHNLGKTTLGRLLDFCLLAGRDKNFFLFKHLEVFKEFEFFLEIELSDGTYVTVRRSVKNASKVSFKKHVSPNQDFSKLTNADWDHIDIPFETARTILDSLLDFRTLKPWTFRNSLGYLLRSQDEYRDIFELRFTKHVHWKPFLAHILGFDAELIKHYYEKEQELEQIKTKEQTIKDELGGSVEDLSKIEGILLLKKKEVEKRTLLLDAFDFRSEDKDLTKKLVDELDERIALLNAERYSLNQNRKKIRTALQEDAIFFNPEEAQRLFKEAGVLFQGQIKKDFEQLIAFNRAITNERSGYLKEELAEVEANLKHINSELNLLGKKRSETLSFLSETDVFNRYRQLTDELVTLRADVTSYERRRVSLRRLQELRAEIRTLTEERGHLQTQIETNVENQNTDQTSLFTAIRIYFSEIIEEVIDRKAVLSVSPNREGHLEFKVAILDEHGNETSADDGFTYRKLLCIAFDLALLRAHLNYKFPRFVYHDGVFESLDNRKKEKLLGVIRTYADLGVQSIITLIDSDLPKQTEENTEVFDSEEIVLTLHDEGPDGLLFKMATW
ncbi:MAG: DUF2326 domain-containing protein [Methylobacter sp.]|nr:DUF2326 domain-containing protein [Methylobacter sp.]